MSRHLDTIARLQDAVHRQGPRAREDRLGLDTRHAHAAGENLEGIVDRVMAQITGRIDLGPLQRLGATRSTRGRPPTPHLGHGQIDPELILEICRQAGAPDRGRDAG